MHALGQQLRGLRLLSPGRDERELVAADAGDERALRRDLEPPRDGAQQLVADDVTEDVVGFLEVIEVDASTAKLSLLAFALAKAGVQPPGEQRAVRQIGQRVVMGEVGDLLVAGEQLGARRAHVLARLVEPERRILAPRSCSTLKLSAISPSSSRELGLTGTMLTEACAASRSPRPSARMASEKSRSVPDVRRLAALLTSVAE